MSTGDFRVADISLADFGRKEIELAEHEVSVPFMQRRHIIIPILPPNH
jgi:S-adenosylhomocysteine hydrolase